jgi:hypothetical protein
MRVFQGCTRLQSQCVAHRDFVLRDDAHAAFSAGVCLLDVQGPADLSAWLAANT